MFKKIRKALDIMKACWKVFLLDKELLVFPLLTLSVLGVLVGGIIWPFWIAGDLPDFSSANFTLNEIENGRLPIVWLGQKATSLSNDEVIFTLLFDRAYNIVLPYF